MMDGGDHDPMELLNHPENIQNGLSFPDLQEDDVEDILSKLKTVKDKMVFTNIISVNLKTIQVFVNTILGKRLC